MSILSPCIGVCRIDPESGLCAGCRRSMTEIAEWLRYSDDDKRRVIADLNRRPFGAGTVDNPRRGRPDD